MKKSQILAALALAFALGVVAPVASTSVFAAEPVTIAVGAETNTESEVNAAIKRIENYGEYKKYAALIEAVEAVSTDGTTVDEVTEVNQAIADLTSAANDIRTNAIATGTSLKDALAIAQRVETAQKYTAWNALYNAVENANTTTDQMVKAIQGVDGGFRNENDDEVSALKQFVTATTGWTLTDDNTANSGNTKYGLYKTLFEAVKDGTETYNAEEALKQALQNVQDWSKISGKEDAINSASKAVQPIAELLKLVGDVNGYDEYEVLYGDVENASKKKTSYESKLNATLISNMENALKAATKEVSGVALKINDLPAVSGTGDGNNTDDNKGDQNAPDTGILANAEGSASTTVAMVAGIATALTAAGAGVVAYRNARRSSRK